MAASDLQIKLFRSNEDIKYLSNLMCEKVYPALIMYMEKLGMEEIRFDGDFNGWKQFCITLDGKIQFFQLKEEKNKEEKINIYELKF